MNMGAGSRKSAILLLVLGCALLAQTPAVCTVEGHVTNAITGALIPDVTVIATNGRQNSTAKTDANGHFILRDLLPGNYAFRAIKDGFEPGVIRRQALAASPDPQQLELQLSEGAVLSGRVIDEDRNPVAHAPVSLRKRTFQYGRPIISTRLSVTTDASGEYQFEHLHPGTYFVFAQPPPAQKQSPKPETELVMTFLPDASSLENAVPIPLRAGERRDRTDIVLRKAPAYCAHGSVLAAGSVPVSLMIAQAAPSGLTDDLAKVNIDKTGAFEACGLAAGAWLLRSSPAPAANGIGPVFEAPFEISKNDVDLGELRAQPVQTVQGSVYVEGARSGDPLPAGTTIILEMGVDSVTPIVLRFTLKSAARFSFPSAIPDPYWLHVRTPPGYYVRQMTAGGLNAMYQPIRPGTGDVQIALGSDGAQVSGQVVDSDNHPLPEMGVILAPAQLPQQGAPGLIQTVQTDEKGAFSFLTAAPGDYLVLTCPLSARDEAESPDYVRTHSGEATRLTLQPRDRQSITLTVH